MGLRGPKPKHTIDTTWRPDLAYVVGLLASDGSLSKDGRHINLTSKDVDQLQTFCRILGIEHIAIGKKVGGYANTLCYQVQFGSILFYRWLCSIGLTENKSKTIAALAVPDEYFCDFLRGLFDGDGSIHSSWDVRWAHSYVYCVDFVSASKNFLEWLQDRTVRLYGVKGALCDSCRVYALRYAKREGSVLLDAMYYDERVPLLQRKFAKVQKIRMIERDTQKAREC
jgi:hypothetical protein